MDAAAPTLAARRSASGPAGAPDAGFDAARADRFACRMAEIVNGGALSLMISLGHRAGLFDVMGRMGAGFATSAEIAHEAGLDERYVREWLGALATGAIVEIDPASCSYRLPPEHAASLTRQARPNNLAVAAQWIPLLARVEDQVLECFARGGGVPYAAYERFHEVMAEESDQTTVAALVDGILPLVPGANASLARGIDVADIGCGSGRAVCALARAFPTSRFTGFDVSPQAIARARAEAADGRLANASFEVRDAADLRMREAFDLITAFDSIHDQARPGEALRAIARALRPGGAFLMQDVQGTSCVGEDAGNPIAPFLYAVSCMHCMSVSLAAGGAGLGAMWGERTARHMLAAAGFERIEVHRRPQDRINQYYVATLPNAGE
jgi:ubiquinone/menaquinone biosynthesis C-methylase UbiE